MKKKNKNKNKCEVDFNPESSSKMGRNCMHIIYYICCAVLSHSVVSDS